MQLIEHQSHFWELYQNNEHYYLSIAVDMSSVVSCWDLVLSATEINHYKTAGRNSIEILAKQIIAAAYRGDFSIMDSRLAASPEKDTMQKTYQDWSKLQNSSAIL